MSVYKVPLEQNVLEAAQERIMWTLETLPRVCVSFSGGKDSGLMLHLTATLARKMNKKIHVLFIDWEAQFSCTIAYIESLREYYADVIERFYWIALPLTTQKFPFTIPAGVAVLAAGCRLGTTTARRCDYRSGLFFLLSTRHDL